jgi:arylsulfatase A-like enzyme
MLAKRFVPWASLALWTAGLLSIARCTAALINENFALEKEIEMALWRLTPSLWEHAFFALAVGMVLSALTRFIVEMNMIVWLKLILVMGLATPPSVYIVRGWSHAVLPDPADPFSPFLPEAIQYLGIVGLILALIHTIAGLITHYLPGRESHFGSWSGVFSGLMLFLAAPVLFNAWGSSTPPTRDYMRPNESLLGDLSWTRDKTGAEEGNLRDYWNENYPPEVGFIQPLETGLGDGARIRSLLMPPPCQAAFQVPEDSPPLMLRAAAGLDKSFNPSEPARVSFYIQVNPQRDLPQDKIFNRSIRTDTPNERERAWQRAKLARYMLYEPEYQDLWETEGIPLEAGDFVVVRTKYHKPVGMKTEDIPYIPAGFAELRLDRRVKKKRQRPTPEEPNIVWIVLDSLRADRMTSYGYGPYDAPKDGEQPDPEGEARTVFWPSTPAIDALAKRGILYENAYAASSDTRGTTASLFTGLGLQAHGFVGDGAFLANRFETVAEVFSERDYWTVAFSCNPWVGAGRNLAQGFDEFDDLDKFRSTHRVWKDARVWLTKHTTTRFFLYLHLSETHHPYRINEQVRRNHNVRMPFDYPRAGIEAFQENRLEAAIAGALKAKRVKPEHRDWMQVHYDMAVETADEYVGGVLSLLKRLALDDRTIVVVTASHGEELLDHGLVTHGHALWEGLVHVPLIIAGPGITPDRVATPVSTNHLASTLASYAHDTIVGLEDGFNLADPQTVEERPVFFSTASGLWGALYPVEIHGVRDGSWVLHYVAGPTELVEALPGQARVRLFDLATDPAQAKDVSADETERVQALLELLGQESVRAEQLMPQAAPENAPETEEETGEETAASDPLGAGTSGG